MEAKYRKAKRATAVIALLLVLCTVLMWGVGTGWGNVTVTRVTIAGNTGQNMKAIQFIPRGVSEDNPAPVFFTNHGNTNSAYSEFVFGMELARRGYIVFCCDQPNAGEAPITTPKATVQVGMTGGNSANMISWVDYALSQKYIDGRVGISGLSRGGTTLSEFLLGGNAEKVECAVNIVCSPAVKMLKTPIGTNYCVITADADASDYYSGNSWVNGIDTRLASFKEIIGDDNYQFGEVLGSFEDKTAMQVNIVRSVHPICYLFEGVHEAFYTFVGQAIPTGTTIAPNNLKYGSFIAVSFICALLLICLGASFAYMLSVAPGFRESMIVKLPNIEPISTKKRIFRIFIDLVIPFILFPLVSTPIKNGNWLSGIFRCTAANPVIGWLFACAIFSAIMLIIRTSAIKKERVLTSSDFGMGNSDEQPFNWKRIKNAVIIGIVTAIVLFSWIATVIDITGINYSANAFAYLTRLTPQRFVRGIPYIIIIFPIVLMININIATTRRLTDSENETINTIRDIVYNILLSIIPLSFLLWAYFGVGYLRGTGQGLFVGGWNTSMNQALGFPFMMGSSVGISSFLYRKTGNIWAGVITATLVLGFFTMTPLAMAS